MPIRRRLIYPPWEEPPPRPEAPAWLLDNIAELSRSTRTLHIIYVGFLLYCVLTTLTTTDRKVVLNKEAHLPIINLDVPLTVFVEVAPLVAIFVFLYFQLYLQALRRTIRELRVEFAPVEPGRIHPWMVNLAEEPEPGLLGLMERLIVRFSLWLLLPVTLILFVRFTLRRHDLWMGLYECAASFAGTVLALWLWRRYDRMAVPDEQAAAAAPDTGRGFTRFVNHWQRSVAGVALIAFNVFLLLMIRDENKIRTGWFNVDLSNEALAEEKKYAGDWVDLHEMHLERANVSGAFLRRANLSGAHLQAANLQRADLANADVSDARLRGASLAEADLTEAILSGADLSGANLNCAVLHGADLREATLRGAYLIGADLTGLPQGVREGAVELFAGVKSLSRARFQDDEVEARLRESRPGLFAEIEPSGAVVNRLAPDPEGSVVIFANGTTQVELLGADASRFGRKKQSEVSTFRDQLKPSYKLLATPEQAEVIARNLPELRGPLSAADEKLRSLRVLSVSEVTPVLVRARHHTYYLEEVFLVVEDSLPPPAARPTLWVFARSREVPVPCIR